MFDGEGTIAKKIDRGDSFMYVVGNQNLKS